MLITLPVSKATFSCQRDLRAPFTTKSLRPSQTRHPQTHRPWMAPSTTWYSATLTHISRSQNYTLPTALRKKVWDWALSSPLSVHLGRLLPERAHPFPCQCTLSASCRGTLSSATHTLPRPFLITQLRSAEGTGGSTWLWQIQGCCLREASCCHPSKDPATCNGAPSRGGGAATALRVQPLGQAQGPVGA